MEPAKPTAARFYRRRKSRCGARRAAYGASALVAGLTLFCSCAVPPGPSAGIPKVVEREVPPPKEDVPVKEITYSRYVQPESVGTSNVFGCISVRIHSVDVYSDRSMRVNVVFLNYSCGSALDIELRNLGAIQLVAEGSGLRVQAIGKAEGQSTGDGKFVLVKNDPMRIAFRFPAFPEGEKPRKVRFVYTRAAAGRGPGGGIGDFAIPDIALFQAAGR